MNEHTRTTYGFDVYVHPYVKNFNLTCITLLDSPDCAMGCYQNQGVIVKISTETTVYCFLVPINSGCDIPDEDKARMYSRSSRNENEMFKRVPKLDLPRTKEDEFYHRLNITPSSSGLAVMTLVVCSKDFLRQTVYQSLIDSGGEITGWVKEEESSKQHSSEPTQSDNQSTALVYKYENVEDLAAAYGRIMSAVENYALSILGTDSKKNNELRLRQLIDEYTKQTFEHRINR